MSTKYDTKISVDRAVNAAEMIIRLYKEVVKDGEEQFPNDVSRKIWHRLDRKQGLADALTAMVVAGVIDGYDLVAGRATAPMLRKGLLVKGSDIKEAGENDGGGWK